MYVKSTSSLSDHPNTLFAGIFGGINDLGEGEITLCMTLLSFYNNAWMNGDQSTLGSLTLVH